jgi:predicted alpha/beta hydrolase family esterase
MNMKRQVMVIHGGGTFKTREDFLAFLKRSTLTYEEALDTGVKTDWKTTLQETLGESWEVFRPTMPCKQNASFDEWSARFEQYIPHMRDGIVLIGHSLGGSFLLRYLSEHAIPVSVAATLLVAPAIGDTPDEPLCSFTPPTDFTSFAAHAGDVHVFHSTDDVVVPVAHTQTLQGKLPAATMHYHEGFGHYNADQVPELLEILQKIPATQSGA